MPDNPNKKKADSKRVSQQPHEEAYQARKRKASSPAPKKTATRKKS